VTYPGFTPVGNATLVVANVLTCNKHSHIIAAQPHPGCMAYLACGTRDAHSLSKQLPNLEHCVAQHCTHKQCRGRRLSSKASAAKMQTRCS
jgi:hypothetical protein